MSYQDCVVSDFCPSLFATTWAADKLPFICIFVVTRHLLQHLAVRHTASNKHERSNRRADTTNGHIEDNDHAKMGKVDSIHLCNRSKQRDEDNRCSCAFHQHADQQQEQEQVYDQQKYARVLEKQRYRQKILSILQESSGFPLST